MHKRLLQVLALAVCLGLLPAAVYAKRKPADKGKSSSDHGSKGTDKDKHRDDIDRDGHYAGHGHDHQTTAGPYNRPAGWDQGNKTGWGDCNVPPGLAKQRGCDFSGHSARERNAHAYHNEVRPRATRSATTTAPTRSGETRGIILQRNATSGRTTTATTTSTPKATQAGQRGGIILQRNATKPAAQNKAAAQK